MKRFRFWLALLLVLNLAARLPLCWEPADVRNDGAEYLAIARSLRTTGRYATDLKYHFYTDDPVRHAAWADRPPLYPAFAALCAAAMPFVDPVAAARLGNVLVASLAFLLAVWYLRRLYDERIALLSAGYVFLLPHTIYWTAQPMTEAVSLFLGIGALLCWLRTGDPNGEWRGGLLSGLATGLLYLARPTGTLLFLALLADAARRGNRRSGAALAGGFALCAVPYHLLLWSIYGSPFHSSLGYAFSVDNYYAVTYYGFERPMLSSVEYLRLHGGNVPGLIVRQAWHHAQALALPLLGLWPFALRLGRESWSGPRWPGLALAAVTIALHTVTWTAWGSSRYFLLCLLLIAPALLSAALGILIRKDPTAAPAPARIWRGLALLLPVLSAAGLAFELTQFYGRELRPDRGHALLPEWRAAAAEVRGASLVASDRPGTLNLLAEVPAVMLPRTTDPEQLSRFVEKYRPETMVLFIDEPEKASAEAMARAWREGRLPPGWRLVRETERTLIAADAGTGRSR